MTTGGFVLGRTGASVMSYAFLILGYSSVLCIFLCTFPYGIINHNLWFPIMISIFLLVVYMLINHKVIKKNIITEIIAMYEIFLFINLMMSAFIFLKYGAIDLTLTSILRLLFK